LKRQSLANAVRNHDWYYTYSDDHQIWSKGKGELRRIKGLISSLKCPFSLHELKAWVFDYINEDYEEVQPDCWFLKESDDLHEAPVKTEELISESTYNDIGEWFSSE